MECGKNNNAKKMAGEGESKGGRICGERLFLICIWVAVPRYLNFSIKQQSTVKGGSQCSTSCARIDVQFRGEGWGVGGRGCAGITWVADFSHGVRFAVVVITSPHSCLSMFKARFSLLNSRVTQYPTIAPNGKKNS